MVGIGTDNASVMTGVNNSVYQKLKAEVPNLILVLCVCYSLQLAISAAVADCLPRNLEYLVSETYSWFSRSASRQLAYKRLYNVIIGEDPLKIVQACSTRWLSIERAVSRIVEQWLELKTHFEIARSSESCYNAEMLYAMYGDDVNLAYLLFLKPILSVVQGKSFEAKDADQTKLLKDLERMLVSLTQKVVLPTTQVSVLTTNIEHHLDPQPYLGYLFENHIKGMQKKGLSSQDEDALRKWCVKFVVLLDSKYVKGSLTA